MSTSITFLRLLFQNFKATKIAEIDLRRTGLTVLHGINGAGKSTYADAFYFALRGRTVHGEKSSEVLSLVHLGDLLVELEFSCSGNHYLVRRTQTRNGVKSSQFFENGEIIGFPTVHEMNAYLKRLCSDGEIFNSVLFNKSSKAFFPILPDSQRRKFFEKLIGASVFDLAETLIAAEIQTNNTKLESAEKEKQAFTIQAEEKRSQSEKKKIADLEQISVLQNRIVEKETENREISAWLEVAETVAIDIKTKQTELTEISKQIFQLETDYKLVLKNKAEIEQNIRAQFLKTKLELNAELAELQQQAANEQERLFEEIRQQTLTLDAEFHEETSAIRKQQEHFRSEKEKNTATVNSKILDISSKISGKHSLQAQITKAVETETVEILKLEEALVGDAICPTCKRPGTSQDVVLKLIQNKKAQVNQANESVLTIRKDVELLTEQLQDLEKTKKVADVEETLKAQNFDTSLKLAEEKKNTNKRKIQEKEKIAQSLREKTQEQTKQLNTRLSDLFELEEKTVLENPENCRILSKLQELERTTASTKITENAYRAELSRLEQTYGSTLREEKKRILGRCAIDLENFSKDIQKLRVEIENAEQIYIAWETKEIQRLTQEHAKYTKIAKVLDFWKKGFGSSGIKKHFLAEILPDLNNRLRKQSEVLTNSLLQVSIALEGKKLVFKANHAVKKSSFQSLSSGEKALVALIFVLAASEMLQAFGSFTSNLMVFDEVFDALDPYNSNLVFEALGKVAQTKRVILITHIPFMKGHDLVDESIEVV